MRTHLTEDGRHAEDHPEVNINQHERRTTEKVDPKNNPFPSPLQRLHEGHDDDETEQKKDSTQLNLTRPQLLSLDIFRPFCLPFIQNIPTTPKPNHNLINNTVSSVTSHWLTCWTDNISVSHSSATLPSLPSPIHQSPRDNCSHSSQNNQSTN